MKRFVAAIGVFAGLAASLPAMAQFQKPEDAIKYRQGAYQVLAAHFGRIAGMANDKIPFDAKAVAENAAIVEVVHKLPFAAFAEGTDKGAPNRAKPEIWKDSAKFKAAADKLSSEIAKLDVAAKGGNKDAIKAAAGGVGSACKGCHDDFRAERYSAQ